VIGDIDFELFSQFIESHPLASQALADRGAERIARFVELVWHDSPRVALADFGEFLCGFTNRTALLMKNHPLSGSVSLVPCLLPDLCSQASRRAKQATTTGRQLGLFIASYRYYVMLVKSEIFQASHSDVDAAFAWFGSKCFSHVNNVATVPWKRRRKRALTEARA
jgi:hypothetical protein